MRAAGSEQVRLSAESTTRHPSMVRCWALVVVPLLSNVYATYYYFVFATVTNQIVLAVGLSILWAVWAAVLIVTLKPRLPKILRRATASAATACVAVSTALYFLV